MTNSDKLRYTCFKESTVLYRKLANEFRQFKVFIISALVKSYQYLNFHILENI